MNHGGPCHVETEGLLLNHVIVGFELHCCIGAVLRGGCPWALPSLSTTVVLVTLPIRQVTDAFVLLKRSDGTTVG